MPCVCTLVERKARFVVLCKMGGFTAEAALPGFTRHMKKLPTFLRDQPDPLPPCTELTCHEALIQRLNIDAWFPAPYASWQRDSNEKTNDLVGQFLPKGADLSQASNEHLNHMANLMKRRPRKTQIWATEAETMEKELLEFRSRVALDS